MTYGYSMNDNQNHFVENGRTTSRVSQLPGGASSICLAWDDGTETKKQKNIPKAGASSICLAWDDGTETKKDDIPQAPKIKVTEKSDGESEDESTKMNKIDAQPVVAPSVAARAGVSSNAFATGNAQNCGNVITDRPTSRVIHPPGGRSSIVFG